MGWTYSGRPSSSSLDAIRFLIGDTDKGRPVVSNEEIEFVLTEKSNIYKAAAMLCRSIAAKYSREVSFSVGDVSKSCGDIAKAYLERAKELDKEGIKSDLVIPRFGGRRYSEKESLQNDIDSIQPFFSRDDFNV